ncbi:MAG: hypothetical protein JW751_08820 [Polyangiaceae bacterium]|nr:hypothetical protein [Polyangiaceae bacterium]
MQAIELSGTDRSYLEASILRRELEEFSARWHGLNWRTEQVIDRDEISAECRRSRALPPGEGWAPRVDRGADRVRVILKIRGCRSQCFVGRVVDEYRIGSSAALTKFDPLADCGRGYDI